MAAYASGVCLQVLHGSTHASQRAAVGEWGGGVSSWLSFSYKLTSTVVFQTQGWMSN